jgi:3'-phosphoadenosine 5'-phosphosulfate sulfotransferase (PAPS reductase)/FAD synthetase
MQGFLNFGHRGLSQAPAPVDVRGARVIASVSGGKDSAAASLLLSELDIEHDRVFMDTGWEHPKTYEYLRGRLTDALGPITEIRGELDFLALVRKKGLFPSRVMRFCTTELKVFPIRDHIARIAATETREVVNVVGIRRAESAKRSKMAEWEWSDTFDCWTWRPLVDWHQADVLAIHEQHGLEINPLYLMGASRVGCWPCIHARKLEIAIVAKHDPERIDIIDRAERELTDEGAIRDVERGMVPVPRTMFSYHGGDSKHFALPIRAAVDWARSPRGEWQPEGDDGCARFGLCSSDPEDEASAPLPLFEEQGRAG